MQGNGLPGDGLLGSLLSGLSEQEEQDVRRALQRQHEEERGALTAGRRLRVVHDVPTGRLGPATAGGS